MSRTRTLIVLIAGAALTVSAFLVMPLVAEDESTLVATAGTAIQYQREEQVVATTTTLPPITTAPPTTAPPPTTTTHVHVEQPAPVQQEAPPSGGGSGDPNDDASWDRLAECETGGTMNWAINTGNGYSGGLQFSLGSWQAVGGTGYPHEASRETQIAMGKRLYAQGGWGHWPGCTRSFGWR